MKKFLSILEKVLLASLCAILFAVPFDNHLVKILYYLALFIWLLLSILKNKSEFYKGFLAYIYFNKGVAAFFLAAVISTIFSLEPYHSQEILFQRYLPYLTLFFLGIYLIKNSTGSFAINFIGRKIYLSNLSIIGSSFLLLGVVIGTGGVWDYFRFHPERLWTVFGKEVSFRMLPLYLAYLIPFTFALFVFGKSKFFKIASFIVFWLLCFVLIMNGSRGGWLAAVSSLIFVVIFSKNKKYMLFSLLLIIFTVGVMPQCYRQRAKALMYPFGKSSFVSRKNLFGFAIDLFKTKPIFGIGVGMYEVIPSPVKEYERDRVLLHAHNTYLEVLCEMGVAGILSFLWIFVVFFKNVFRPISLWPDKNTRAIQIGLIGAIFANLVFSLSCTTITVGFQDAVLFWLFLGICSGLLIKKQGENKYIRQ